jgi:hypothetical protein
MSIRRKELVISNNPDVAISIGDTPAGRRITKIESFFTQMMTSATPRKFLRITVFTVENSGGHLRTEIRNNRWNNTQFWKYSWNLNPADLEQICSSAPQDALVWGECLIFMTEEPQEPVIFLPRPNHPDNPLGALLRDRRLQHALQPGKKYRLTSSAKLCTKHKIEA